MFWKIKSKEYKDLLDKLEKQHRRISMMEIDIEALNQRFKRKIKQKKEEDLKEDVSSKKGGLITPQQYKNYGIDR